MSNMRKEVQTLHTLRSVLILDTLFPRRLRIVRVGAWMKSSLLSLLLMKSLDNNIATNAHAKAKTE